MILKLKKKKFLLKKFIFFKRLDIEKVLVSKNISSVEKYCKYFIGYLHNYFKVKPLHIMLPKTSPYLKSYDSQTKWIDFLIEKNDLLEKYNTIWDKVSADIKKELDSESVYDKKILKIKIKFEVNEVINFLENEITKVDSDHTCLAVISLDSAFKKANNDSLSDFSYDECDKLELVLF